MTSKERASEALYNIYQGPELGRLLVFLKDLPPEELGLLRPNVKDDTIAAYVATLADRAVGAAAGLGPGSTAATSTAAAPGSGSTAADVEQRARFSARFVAHDDVWRVLTVIYPSLLVSTAHSYPTAQRKDKIQVYVNDTRAPSQRKVTAVVKHVIADRDIIFLELINGVEVEAPPLDLAANPGSPYLLLGASNRSHACPYSVSHGNIATTELDEDGNIRGDSASTRGDSGGGCFAIATGKLMAINLGADLKNPGKSVLKSVAAVVELLRSTNSSKE